MPMKTFFLSTNELEDAVKTIVQMDGWETEKISISFNETTEKDIALVTVENEERELLIESLTHKLNDLFSIHIKSYEGYHYTDFDDMPQGHAFILS